MTFIVLIIILLTGCQSSQKAVLIEDPEARIYKSFDEQNEDLYIEDLDMLDIDYVKQLYLEQMDYSIDETELRKTIQVQSNKEVIIAFDPVVDTITLNSSYILIIRDDHIKALSSNPTKYIVPDSFTVEDVLSLDEQEELKEETIKKMSRKGEAKIAHTDLYFDTQRTGKLIYTIKVDVETSDYVFAKVFVYDGYSGDIID